MISASLVANQRHSKGNEIDRNDFSADQTSRETDPRALAEAQAANAANTALLARLRHEICTPMTTLVGMAELLRDSGVTPEQKSRLNAIEDAVQHLLSIVNDVLDLLCIDAGEPLLDQRAINVAGIVSSVVDLSAAETALAGGQLRIEVGTFPGVLLGDATRIRQALLHSVASVCKAVPGATITLAAQPSTVDDEGVAVRFEVYAQKTPGPSAGVDERALAVVGQTAAVMGGSSGLRGPAGQAQGLWFTIRLKKALDKRSTRTEEQCQANRAGADRRRQESRILVVDDDRANRALITAMLDTIGVPADVAANGRQAVELAMEKHYALILMDLQMPEMGGCEASRRIRRLPSNADVPILALSGYITGETQQECRAAGMNDFLCKPFAMNALLEVVTRCLRTVPH